MDSRKPWIVLAILAMLCGPYPRLYASEAIGKAAHAGQCSPAPHWWADHLEELQTSHLIAIGHDLQWDGKRLSFASLKSELKRIGQGKLAHAHQIGIVLRHGGDCRTLEKIRALMERSLDCKAAMCRDGDLKTPLPPPP